MSKVSGYDDLAVTLDSRLGGQVVVGPDGVMATPLLPKDKSRASGCCS